jgi:UDP-3-O-[3-hydroxymyristoyl] N-acetylglucosamine deacetylase
MQQQHTLRDVLEFEGVGLHTGAGVRVKVRPQVAGSGLRFRLGEGGPVVPALAENVTGTRLATVIGSGDRTVSTVEHILSALLGMGVDNALIEVDGPEIPVMDGSAAAFAQAIEHVGTVAQNTPRALLAVDRAFFYRDGEARLIILPADEFRIKFFVDYAPPIGTHYFDEAIDPATYLAEIAPARTFGQAHEVEALLAAGLARGGTLDNALVFAPDGPLTPLRWPNEVVRHKVLDLIGDMALLGARPMFEVISIKSGHRLHAVATNDLRAAYAPARAASGR